MVDEPIPILIIGIISLILINQGMDFFREGYGANNWKLGLPLHLCDFSSASIILYFITKRREFFLFAFFAGIAGAGMAILTPDVLYSFPHIDYLRHMIGHSMILLGVTYAIIIDNHLARLWFPATTERAQVTLGTPGRPLSAP